MKKSVSDSSAGIAQPSKSESEALLCDIRLQYSLENKVGEGRFSEVWKAKRRAPCETGVLAVKIFKIFRNLLHPSIIVDNRERIEQEANILNIVRDGVSTASNN